MLSTTSRFVAGAMLSIGLASVSHAAVIINEVYPGGGANSGTPAYNRDFVELYNNGSLPVSLAGYSLQYASAANSFTNTIVNFGAGSVIAPNGYLTVVAGATGSAGGDVPAGSATYFAPASSASLSGTAGAVRLFNGTAAVDIVGYGGVTSPGGNGGDIKIEGTAAAAPTSTAVSIGRTGFVDTNNNLADFSSQTPSPTTSIGSIVLVPEPTSIAAILGLGGLALRRRK